MHFRRKYINIKYEKLNITCFADNDEERSFIIEDIGSKSLAQVAKEYTEKSLNPTEELPEPIPTYLGGLLTDIKAYVNGAMGISIPLTKYKKCTSLAAFHDMSKYNFDRLFAPFRPDVRAGFSVVIGPVKDTPVVRDGVVCIEKISSHMVTLDHRYGDGTRLSKLQHLTRKVITTPEEYFDLAEGLN